MSAHLYPGIKSLHLILDTPYDLIRTDDIRDDIIGVKVWYSDTSGFDPANGEGTLIFDGLSLSVTIPNLLTNTRYYVRYAFISSIDPTTYTISAELTEIVYDESISTYGYLTNTPTAIATDAAGEGGNFSLATGIFKVYNLSQDVTGNGTVYSIKPGSVNHVLGVSIDATTGVYKCTGMDANTGSVTFLATYGGIVIELVWNLYKGIAGANAPLIQLSATNSDFIFKDQYATVSLTPQTDITANLVNITGTPTFTAIAYTREGNTLGNVSFTQNGNSITITGGQFAALGTSVGTVQVTATLDNVSDTYTLYRINDGTEQITVELTNVAHVIPAANNGDTLPANYVGSGTIIKVKQGNTYLMVDPTTPTDSLGTWNIFDITSSNITCDPTPTIGTDYINFDTHAAMTADQAYIDYTILYRTTTGYVGSQTVRQSFAKSREGVVGRNSILLTLFKRTATSTAPSVTYAQPTSTYNFKLGTITDQPDGWTLTAPTNTQDPYLWSIQLSISSNLESYTFSNSLWPSTPTLYAKNGTDGPYVEISGLTTIYRNSGGALTPTNISLTATTHNISSPTYSWSVTGASPATATGVSITITPDGTAPVAVTLTVSGSNISAPITLTRTMAIVDQGIPGQAGANGVMSAYPSIYRWAAGTAAPTRPITTSTYTWSTGAYTAPTNWSIIAPSNTTSNYTLWEITIPLSVPATTTTSTLDWTNTAYAIRAVAYNGSNGSSGIDGLNGSAMYLIDRGTSTTSTAPTATEVYTKLGRYAVAGDIATTLYSSGTASKTWQATTSGSAATWSLITTYLSGSLIVQNTITGDKISANTITASKLASTSTVGTDGTFSLDTSSVQANGKYAIGQFYTTADSKFALTGLSANTSSAAGGIVGGAVTTGGFGIGAYNAKTSNFSTFNTSCSLGTYASAGYYKFIRAAGDSLATANTEVNICTSGDGVQGNYFSESGSYRRLSFYLNNTVDMNAGIFRYHNTTGAIVTEARLGGSTYAVNVPTGLGSSYFGGVVVPFTAAHDGLVSDYANVVPGDIIVDMEVLKHIDISNSIVRMEASIEPNQKGVVGVCNEIFAEPPQDWQPSAPVQDYVYAMDEDIGARPRPSTYDNAGYYPIPEGMRVLHVNAIGEGLINVCGEAGNIEKGDLIVTSSIRGKGMLQADDIVRSTTVAKARESVAFDYPTQVKQIACIYMCG